MLFKFASAVAAAVTVAIASAAPLPASSATLAYNTKPFAAVLNSTGNDYPIIMIHGLLGWGEKPLLGAVKYWGGLNSDIVGDLRSKGYTVHQPAVGPASSNWERACELYAQITGSRVDYGVARSSKFGHERFGRNYTGKALYKAWGTGPDKKVHLIGHSMGGPTGRMVLLEEIAAAEAAGVPASPLFYTNRTSSYIHSFTSIAGVLRGTTFSDVMTSLDLLNDFSVKFAKTLIGANNALAEVYDFHLEHWGLNPLPGEQLTDFFKRVCSSTWFYAKSSALWDLRVQAARDPLLSFVKNAPDTYYFSVAGDTTFNVLANFVARPDTLAFLQPSANIIGFYPNRTLLGDESRLWRPNDGLVPIVSSQGDDAGYVPYGVNLFASTAAFAGVLDSRNVAPSKGVFHYLQTLEGRDHLGIVGMMDLVVGQMNQVYANIAGLVSSLAK
ncbi:hypothetical protein HDU96_001297 [Phlyctochytrium bullatum]|nr:hypothetical protein HDU96_001297 [Phlyctochytrium bullatum]